MKQNWKWLFIAFLLLAIFFPLDTNEWSGNASGIRWLSTVEKRRSSLLISIETWKSCLLLESYYNPYNDYLREVKIPYYNSIKTEKVLTDDIWYLCEISPSRYEFRIGILPLRSFYATGNFPENLCIQNSLGFGWKSQWSESEESTLCFPNLFLVAKHRFDGEVFLGFGYDLHNGKGLEGEGIWFNELYDTECSDYWIHACYKEVNYGEQ